MTTDTLKSPALVITTCSAGKRCRAAITAESLVRANQSEVSKAWVALLGRETYLTPAKVLYQGSAFRLALAAAEIAHADLGIVSGGLGYVHSNSNIPSYDLTIRPRGPGSVLRRINDAFDSRAWWQAVQAGPFSMSLAEDLSARRVALVCLSRGYSELIGADLAKFSDENSEGLRIFGLSIQKALPEQLRAFVLPYDERLEGSSSPGTRVNFPQRALMHYVKHIRPRSDGLLATDAALVEAELCKLRRPERLRNQQRVDNETMKKLIGRAMPIVGGNGGRILAYIRHVDGVSCEQQRFAAIYRTLRAEQSL
jgi:hypothetical protein